MNFRGNVATFCWKLRVQITYEGVVSSSYNVPLKTEIIFYNKIQIFSEHVQKVSFAGSVDGIVFRHGTDALESVRSQLIDCVLNLDRFCRQQCCESFRPQTYAKEC